MQTHGSPLAVPRGFLAAKTGRPLPLFSRPLKQTHGASPKGSTLPCTMQNATLGARGASPREVAHAERRWRMHGGSKTRPPQRQRRRSWGGRHASCGWSEGGSQLLLQAAAAVSRRAATPPLPATDPERSKPGGAGVRGRRALSGGSTRGARGAGTKPNGCGFESFGELPRTPPIGSCGHKAMWRHAGRK